LVAFDPLPEFTESGHISARHLDDKAGVAALLAALKAIVDSGEELLIDCHPLFTITEETGSGAAAALPWDVSEFVGIDIAPVAPGQHSSEHAVSVAMQDSGGPYDYHLSRHLLRLASENELPVRRDLFRYYFSDAHSAVTAGHDIRTALLAFGCDATHGYERTHIDSLAALSRLLGAYILSPPVFASDAATGQWLHWIGSVTRSNTTRRWKAIRGCRRWTAWWGSVPTVKSLLRTIAFASRLARTFGMQSLLGATCDDRPAREGASAGNTYWQAFIIAVASRP
jgi:hypothetical protein